MNDLRLYRGHYVRKDRHDDAAMIKECHDVYRHFSFGESETVLDLGVNVGGFATMALTAGIKKYIGVEADPENMDIAQLNIELMNPNDTPVVLLDGAASASDAKNLIFYQTETGNAKCSGTIAVNSHNLHSRTVQHEVPNFPIAKLIAKYEPTLIKMDIEGAEYDWFESIDAFGESLQIPDHVYEIAFDLHRMAGIKKFEEKWLPLFLEEFHMISAVPNCAFTGKKEMKWELPKFGLSGTGMVYALDVFFRRKLK